MNDEKYFVDTYKETALQIVEKIKDCKEILAPTLPENDPMRNEIVRFVLEGGKRFRPSLSYLTAKFYGMDDMYPHLALETFHKYLLTHDDIMDRDAMRYSAPTVHKKLEEIIHPYSNDDAERLHFGNGLAIVAGDMMEAATNKIIIRSQLEAETKIALCELVAGAAEEAAFGWYDQLVMDYTDLDSKELSYQRIETSIIWVTGKYTMKFPLHFGFVIAGVVVPEGIDHLADDLGVLFQTGDDLIGLFGDPDKTGKSNYGDIVQGKKTLPMWFTYTMANDSDKEVLKQLVGKKDLTHDEAQVVRAICERSGALARSKELMREYRDACLGQIDGLDIPDDMKRFLRGFTEFLEKRDR
ncbi:MAG: polyprenyl synthetase family protein [bacterium]|nr:polyprenyl synthetase family protein [bacterium]